MMEQSAALFERAKKVLPGGVNSPGAGLPLRGAHTPVHRQGPEGLPVGRGRQPLHRLRVLLGTHDPGHNHPLIREAVERAVKDGLSFGASTQREVEIAELMTRMVPHLEMAADGQLRHRGGDVRPAPWPGAPPAGDKIVKFEGCYHGHSDCMLVKAGSSAVAEGGKPSSAGVPLGTAKDTLTASFNDLESVKALFAQYPGRSPVSSWSLWPPTWGWWAPTPAFCRAFGTSATGRGRCSFSTRSSPASRLAKGGAGEYYGVRADLVTFGKIIGGGMPVGAYGGSRSLMEQVAPCGPVYPGGYPLRQTRWPWPRAWPSSPI